MAPPGPTFSKYAVYAGTNTPRKRTQLATHKRARAEGLYKLRRVDVAAAGAAAAVMMHSIKAHALSVSSDRRPAIPHAIVGRAERS